MSEYTNYCDEIGGICKDMEVQDVRIAELEQENHELLAKCEKYECEIGLLKHRIAALESKSNMYSDLAIATASDARKVYSLEKERDRLREALQRISCYQTPIAAYWQNEVLTIVREALEGIGK